MDVKKKERVITLDKYKYIMHLANVKYLHSVTVSYKLLCSICDFAIAFLITEPQFELNKTTSISI